MQNPKKIVSSIVIIGVVLIVSIFIFDENFKNLPNKQLEAELIEWDSSNLFQVLVNPDDLIMVNGKTIPLKAEFGLKTDLESTYKKIGFFDEKGKAIFIIPTFTASAYSKNGFYDYFNENCNKQCLTKEIVAKEQLDYNSSSNAVKILELLKYDSITDFELHKNPDILKKYEKVVILHNEYVSKIMFDAITSHKNVIFLYPNALYGEIKVDTINKKITLVRGHGYPEDNIKNGFDWENENTNPYEFDNKCEKWEFYSITNGFMLNCYPEQIIWKNESLLKTLKEL